MDMKQPHPHSVWLCPAPGIGATLRDEITGLAALSGTAHFDPHVTLLGDLSGPPAATHEACTKAFQGKGPIRATVSGLGRTDAYFMALFLDLVLTPDLDPTRAAICRCLGIGQPPAFRPHLSLAYGLGMSHVSARLETRLEPRYSGKEIPLTSVVTVLSSRDIPIADWRILKTLDLTSQEPSPATWQ